MMVAFYEVKGVYFVLFFFIFVYLFLLKLNGGQSGCQLDSDKTIET